MLQPYYGRSLPRHTPGDRPGSAMQYSDSEGEEAYSLADLRRGFTSDDDSVVAVVGENGMEEGEGRSLLSVPTDKRHRGGEAGEEGDKAFVMLKKVVMVLGLVLVLAFAVTSGGYVMSQSGSEEDGVTYKFSDVLYGTPTASPTRLSGSMGYLTADEESSVLYHEMSDDEKESIFDLFISSFGKVYSDTETMEARFKKFKTNLKIIDARNTAERAMGGSAVHGITKFTDLDEDEFKSVYLTASPMGMASGAVVTEVSPYEGKEEAVTWEGIYTRGIHDQGYCGACWAYSVTEQMQADAIRAGLITLNVSLSAQQILSCDTASFGCGGGWTERAYQYVQEVGGVALDESYPYTSYYDMTGTCKEDASTFFMTTDGYYTVDGEQAMIDYVKSTGPLSACIDATNWASYVKGVVSVCGVEVDHCVQIIGVDTDSEDGSWLIRNSWGAEWGEGGYIRLSVGNNTCAITNDPTFSKPVMLTGASRKRL